MSERLNASQQRRVAEVFESHRRFVEAVAMRHVDSDRTEAAEVVQEVAVRLCRRLNGLREPAALRCWIYKLTVNAARDRRSARLAASAAQARLSVLCAAEPVENPDDVVRDRERRESVGRALLRLSPLERAVIRHRFGLGRRGRDADGRALTLEEVSRELDMPISTVHKAERRAIDRLRAVFMNRATAPES